jgi:hypothetical protein
VTAVTVALTLYVVLVIFPLVVAFASVPFR